MPLYGVLRMSFPNSRQSSQSWADKAGLSAGVNISLHYLGLIRKVNYSRARRIRGSVECAESCHLTPPRTFGGGSGWEAQPWPRKRSSRAPSYPDWVIHVAIMKLTCGSARGVVVDQGFVQSTYPGAKDLPWDCSKVYTSIGRQGRVGLRISWELITIY